MSTRTFVAPHATASRSSAAVAVSLVVTSLIATAQGLLIAFINGQGPQTDAFLASSSIYLVIVLFGASLRASLVPLIGAHEDEERVVARARELLARLLLLGLLLGAVLLAAAPLLGRVLTHALPRGAQSTAVISLLTLVPAGVLQVYASAMSAVLSAGRRFPLSALLYAVCGSIGLAASAGLMYAVGVVGAGLGLLLGSVLLAASHAAYLARFGIRIAPRRPHLTDRATRTLAVSLLAGASLGVALQVDFALALSAVSREPGAITAYSYAFYLVTAFLTVTSLPLGLATLPDVLGRLDARGRSAARDHLGLVAPYAFAVLTPLLGTFAAFGRPILRLVFDGYIETATVDLLYELGLILGAMALPAALLFLVAPLTLALGRTRAYVGVAIASVLLQAAVVLTLASVGPRAVGVGHAVSVALTTLLLLAVTFGRGWPGAACVAMRRASPAFGLATIFVLGRLVLGSHPTALVACVGALVALLAYGLLTLVVWPEVSAGFLRLVRPSARGAV